MWDDQIKLVGFPLISMWGRLWVKENLRIDATDWFGYILSFSKEENISGIWPGSVDVSKLDFELICRYSAISIDLNDHDFYEI